MTVTMHVEHGIYIDDVWHQWLPPTSTDQHGWASSAVARAHWSHPDREHRMVPYLNGRETPTAMTAGVKVDDGYRIGIVVQRVWFEGEGQQTFDLGALA